MIILGEGVFTEQGDMSSDSSCSQKVESATVGVCQWQEKKALYLLFLSNSVRMPKVTLPARLLPVNITPLLKPVVPDV